MQTDLTTRHHFRQAPVVVNARYSLTRSQTDLVFALLTELKLEDDDFKDYTLTKKQLEVKLGVRLDTTQLRNTAKGLMSKIIEFVNDEEDWELLTWFSYFAYKKGVITYRFDKSMKPYLLQLKQFVSADIRHIVQMKSEYSKRVYMLIKERQKFGVRKFDVEELMEQLEVPKSFRVYSEFKKKVLMQSVKDINKFTDIEIKNIGTSKKPIYFEEYKPSRKIIAVTFHFKKNLADLKQFISWIRELYVNEPLYEGKDGHMLKCSEKGLLYYADDAMEWLDEKTAQKSWEWLHENREKLYCFQPSLLDYTEETV